MIYGHGWSKLQRLFEGARVSFADPFGFGPLISLVLVVLAEFACALLVVLGWYTRWAVIPLIVTMLTAILYAHWGDPFGDWEKALLFLTAYLTLGLAGPGWYSLDEQWRKKL